VTISASQVQRGIIQELLVRPGSRGSTLSPPASPKTQSIRNLRAPPFDSQTSPPSSPKAQEEKILQHELIRLQSARKSASLPLGTVVDVRTVNMNEIEALRRWLMTNKEWRHRRKMMTECVSVWIFKSKGWALYHWMERMPVRVDMVGIPDSPSLRQRGCRGARGCQPGGGGQGNCVVS